MEADEIKLMEELGISWVALQLLVVALVISRENEKVVSI